jgi:hypothetical protein
MNKYAFIVRNNEGTWDVWSFLNDIPIPSRKERVQNALASGLPIVGKNLTEYGTSVKSGAVWNGTKWTGGEPTNRTEDNDDGLFSFVHQDTIILTIVIPKLKQPNYDMAMAVFEEENTVIEIPDGVEVHAGYIWDGENFYAN